MIIFNYISHSAAIAFIALLFFLLKSNSKCHLLHHFFIKKKKINYISPPKLTDKRESALHINSSYFTSIKLIEK